MHSRRGRARASASLTERQRGPALATGAVVTTEGALDDLSRRWRRARRAAAVAVTGHAPREASDDALLACAAEVDALELHRRLFENSATLGRGFVRFHQRAVGLEELPAVLGALDSECLSGAQWEAVPGERALRGTRRPCAAGCDAARCDAWREAIDGLVLGLTGDGRHTRIASAGHGQARCVDVVTTDPESPARYGELPHEVVPALEAVQRLVRRFRDSDVRFLGLSEGELLYRLNMGGCGGSAGARALIEATLSKKLPHLRPREVSPRPVLGDSTAAPTHEGHNP